jgi:hypothetical protein
MVKRSSKTRYEITCKSTDCPWHLYAAPIAGTAHIFRIRTYHNQHNCIGIAHLDNRQASAKFIANTITQKLVARPGYGLKDIQCDLQVDLGVHIPYSRVYRGKEAAMTLIHGTHEAGYMLLPNYCADIEKSNPGSIVALERTVNNEFLRVFISYNASGAGFAFCRPLLGLDGTHLKTKYKGILLAATAIDAKGQLFPVAHAVVDAENDDNWLWMLKLLRRVIETHAPESLSGQVHQITAGVNCRNLSCYWTVRKDYWKVLNEYFQVALMVIVCDILMTTFARSSNIQS